MGELQTTNSGETNDHPEGRLEFLSIILGSHISEDRVVRGI